MHVRSENICPHCVYGQIYGQVYWFLYNPYVVVSRDVIILFLSYSVLAEIPSLVLFTFLIENITCIAHKIFGEARKEEEVAKVLMKAGLAGT